MLAYSTVALPLLMLLEFGVCMNPACMRLIGVLQKIRSQSCTGGVCNPLVIELPFRVVPWRV
eukprot:3819181-Amphidinium_carterae.1